MRPPPLDALTGLRFFAALHVVLFHAIGGAGFLASVVGQDGPLWRLAQAGYVEVSLFFMLSGFVLTYNYAGEGAGLDRRRFWAARFARIYPVYLCAFLLVAPFVIARDPDFPLSARAILAPDGRALSFFTLTQAWIPSRALMWNSPSWSISVEALFYLSFPLMLLLIAHLPRRLERPAMAGLWVATCTPAVLWWLLAPADAANVLQGRSDLTNLVKFFPLFRLPEFVLGMLLARRHLRDGPPEGWPRWMAAGCFATAFALIACAPAIPFAIVHNGLFDPLFAIALVALSSVRDPLSRLLSSAPLVLLGEASYSLYLIHVPLLKWHTMLMRSLGWERDAFHLAVYLGLSIAASLACYLAIERPLRVRLIRWLAPPADGRPPPGPWLRAGCALIAVALGLMLWHRTASAPLWSEKACIGRALAAGRGYADPFMGDLTGPTAWCAPALPTLLGALFWVAGGKEAVAAAGMVALNGLALAATTFLLLAVVRRTCRRPGPWGAAAVIALGYSYHYWYWFERADDCGLYMLLLDAVLAAAFWGAPFASAARAAAWGALGGAAALANPVIAFVWAALTVTLSVRERAPRLLVPAAAVALAVISPWVLRNALVFGRPIPMKSNLAFEIYQAQVLQPDGLLQLAPERRNHPRNAKSRDGQEYRTMGEVAYLDLKKQQVRDAIASDPLELARRIALRAWGATLWYLPYQREDAERLPFAVNAKRLAHPLPFLALLVLIALRIRRPLGREQQLAILAYVAYLFPYVATSYYERYAVPLDVVKLMLVLWALDALRSRHDVG